MQNDPVIVEQTYNATVDKVWNAITVCDLMKKWYFETMTSFKPEVGFETQVNVHANNQDYMHIWKVTEVEYQKRLMYNWIYRDYNGNSHVLWELSPDGNFTKLKLTHVGIESFPQDNPDFSRKSFMEGWNFIIRKQLKYFLEKP